MAPLLSTLQEREVDTAFDSHAQEVSVGQGHNGVTPHIWATPCATKSANMRPHDQHHNRRRDPTSWNLADKPKDETPLVILSFAVDECCECDRHAQFHVCPTHAVMENAHMEAAGIEISRGLLWDCCSANAHAVLGFMVGHWSALHPNQTHKCCKVPHSKCAEQTFTCSWCIACAPIVLQQGLLTLHNKCGIARFDPQDLQQSNALNAFDQVASHGQSRVEGSAPECGGRCQHIHD